MSRFTLPRLFHISRYLHGVKSEMNMKKCSPRVKSIVIRGAVFWAIKDVLYYAVYCEPAPRFATVCHEIASSHSLESCHIPVA